MIPDLPPEKSQSRKSGITKNGPKDDFKGVRKDESDPGYSRSRVEFAHLLRGIAAGSVLLHHYFYMFWNKPQIVANLIVQPDMPRLIENLPPFGITDFGVADFWGHFGVALFFLISGFVIPFSVASLPPAGFVIARVLRIWPTYIVGFTVTIACLAVNAANAGVAFPYRTWEVLSHYLIIPRWPTLTRPIDGILWTLEIEIFFYFFCYLFFRFSIYSQIK